MGRGSSELVISNAKTVRHEIAANKNGAVDRLRDILQGNEKTKTRWIELALVMLKRPDLADCDRLSLFAAVKSAAVLNLELDGELGHGCIIPYKGEAKFIAGYRGKIVLADRAGFAVDAAVVYEGDYFDYEYGLEPKVEHKPERDPQKRGTRTAAYVVFTDKVSGRKLFHVTEGDRIEAIKKEAPSARSRHSPWNHEFHEDWMWLKTAIGQGMKLLPLSPNAMRAVIYDEYNTAGLGQEKPSQRPDGRFGFGRSLPAPADAPETQTPESQAEGTGEGSAAGKSPHVADPAPSGPKEPAPGNWGPGMSDEEIAGGEWNGPPQSGGSL